MPFANQLVHERLNITRFSKFVCAIILGLIILLGSISFIIYLSLRPHRPRIYIHDFSISGSDPKTQKDRMKFNFTARNPNQSIGIYYDFPIDVSAYYWEQLVGFESLFFPFFQHSKNTTAISGEMSGGSVSGHGFLVGKMMFRLEITTTIQFKIATWRSGRHRMHADCDVEVGEDGLMVDASRKKRCYVYFTSF